jgi:predicted DNA-binding ribbon-helix-helix protein
MVTAFGACGRLYTALTMSGARLTKKSISIAGHRTSIALEAEFWAVLEEKAVMENRPLVTLIAAVDRDRNGPLTSALRIHAVNWLRERQQR